MSEPAFPPDCAARFRLVRRLGQGGFGAVYLATQVSLQRAAAVKVLHGDARLEAGQVERFLAEARMTASLHHPHVVRIYDHGAAEGVPWIAYEHLSGETLAQRVEREGRLGVDDALSAVAQVAAALEAAHEAGITHRDVKPENVIQAPDGHCKLMDFGIGKWAGGVRTEAGLILGTPGFIAPEDIRGETAGPAGDLYSLGVTLFVLITGQLPFTGTGMRDLLVRQAQEDPPPPSRFAALAPEVDALLGRLIARRAADRPGSARAVREELERLRALLSGRPAPALPRVRSLSSGSCATRAVTAAASRPHALTAVATRGAPTPPGTRLRRRLPATLLVAAGLGAAGVFGYARRAVPVSPSASAPAVAVADGVALERAGKKREAADAYGARIAAGSAEPGVHLRHAYLLFELGERAASIAAFQRAAELFPGDPEVRAGLGRVLFVDGRAAEAEKELRRALAAGCQQPSYIHHLIARSLIAQGKPDAAVPEMDAAESSDPDNADVHVMIAADLYGTGQRVRARPHLDVLKRNAPADPHWASAAGALLMEERRWDEALKLLRVARAQLPHDREARVRLAATVMALKGDAEGVDALAEVLADNPVDVESLALLARLHAANQRAGPALDLVERVVRMSPVGVGEALRLEVLVLLGRTADLPAAVAAAVERVEAKGTFIDLQSLGLRLGEMKRRDVATRLLERAHALDPKQRMPLVVLSWYARAAGNRTRAIELGFQAAALPGTSDGDLWHLQDSIKDVPDEREREALLRRLVALAPRLADPCKALAQLLMAQDRYDEAREWIQRAIRLDPHSQKLREMLVWIELERPGGRAVSASARPPPSPRSPPPGAPAAR